LPKTPWLVAAAPALIYLAIRQIGVVLLSIMSNPDQGLTDRLTSWDGQWFLGITQQWYQGIPGMLVDAHGNRNPDLPMAFFPGYPAVVRLVASLPGVTLAAAGITVALVCGVIAAYGLVRIGELIPGGSRRVGLLLMIVYAAQPMAIVETMMYSESLFVALAAWGLVALLKRDWLVAGLLAALLGLVRLNAAALIAVVCLAALIAIYQRRDGWRPYAALAMAPVGFLGYLGWVALRTHSLFGYFAIQQQGWDSQFDFGLGTVKFIFSSLGSSREVLMTLSVAIIIGVVVLAVLLVRTRLPWSLVAYGLLVLFMDIGSNGLMNSKARLLIPAFTLGLPIAIGLAKRKPSTIIAVIGALVLFSSWFGAYSLTVWPYAI
jgi:Gpi18-like mannosyltransferase